MDHVFSAIGGSGSAYLIGALSERYEVGNKPDTVFRSQYPELWVAPRGPWFRRISRPRRNSSFRARTGGYRARRGAVLEDVLPGYLTHLRASPQRTAVFNTCAELGLFSRYAVEDVVFLVRHPVHAYVSWAKPERHGRTIDDLGGLGAPRGLEYYGRRWTRVAEEIVRLDAAGILGGVIRYERARRDAQALGLEWVFEGFDEGRRNFGVLPPGAETQLREIVSPGYSFVYGAAWDEPESAATPRLHR